MCTRDTLPPGRLIGRALSWSQRGDAVTGTIATFRRAGGSVHMAVTTDTGTRLLSLTEADLLAALANPDAGAALASDVAVSVPAAQRLAAQITNGQTPRMPVTAQINLLAAAVLELSPTTPGPEAA